MKKTFKEIIKELGRTDTLKLSAKNFSGEIILNPSLQCCVLDEINFSNCNFENVNFTGSNFINCQFQKIDFRAIYFQNFKFLDPEFKECEFDRYFKEDLKKYL